MERAFRSFGSSKGRPCGVRIPTLVESVKAWLDLHFFHPNLPERSMRALSLLGLVRTLACHPALLPKRCVRGKPALLDAFCAPDAASSHYVDGTDTVLWSVEHRNDAERRTWHGPQNINLFPRPARTLHT